MKRKSSLSKTKVLPVSGGVEDGRRFRILVLLYTLVLLFLIWWQHEELVKMAAYGYLGVFLVNFFSSATILLPFPGVASVLLGGAIWPPLPVGIISGLGATLGELFGYFMGYGGRGLLRAIKHDNHWLGRVEELFRKTGFVTIFVFSLIPFPLFDFIGILAGALNYPMWKFALATLIGRVFRNILIAWTGAKVLPI